MIQPSNPGHRPSRHVIFVGDVHVVPSEIADCQKLIVGLATLRQYADTIVFLGDQFHNHGVVHLAVVQFWRQSFIALKSLGFNVVCLVGNHDISSSGSMWPNAMQCTDGTGVDVVDRARVMGDDWGDISMMPYVHDRHEFVVVAKELKARAPGAKTLICHQTFTGAQYDNGFFASDGVEIDEVPFDFIVSGHIHTQAQIGKLFYLGSPRWRSRDDANRSKSVGLFNIDTNAFERFFDTSAWCSPILHWELGPDTMVPDDPPTGARVTVTLRGPAEWVREQAQIYKDRGFGVRRLPDAVAAPRVRESAPVNQSFATFLKAFKTPNGTPPEVLEGMVTQCMQ